MANPEEAGVAGVTKLFESITISWPEGIEKSKEDGFRKPFHADRLSIKEYLINKDNKVLFLGEGNFTFSAAVAACRRTWKNIIPSEVDLLEVENKLFRQMIREKAINKDTTDSDFRKYVKYLIGSRKVEEWQPVKVEARAVNSLLPQPVRPLDVPKVNMHNKLFRKTIRKMAIDTRIRDSQFRTCVRYLDTLNYEEWQPRTNVHLKFELSDAVKYYMYSELFRKMIVKMVTDNDTTESVVNKYVDLVSLKCREWQPREVDAEKLKETWEFEDKPNALFFQCPFSRKVDELISNFFKSAKVFQDDGLLFLSICNTPYYRERYKLKDEYEGYELLGANDRFIVQMFSRGYEHQSGYSPEGYNKKLSANDLDSFRTLCYSKRVPISATPSTEASEVN